MRYYIVFILQRLANLLLKWGFIKTTERQVQIQLMAHYRQLVQKRDQTVDFEDIGFNTYSPTYEDGILLYIFSSIGMTNKKLVDIGAGTVQGSSTANLIINHGFSGLLIDGNPDNTGLLNDYYRMHPETRYLPPTAIPMMVVRESINQVLSDNDCKDEIDLLCIDIDGIDYWIWQAIDVIQPRVVLVEYQDILGPDHAWTVPYKSDFTVSDYPVNNQQNNYCGASLKAFYKLGKEKGYRLVGCSKGGWNAFFVKDGLGEEEIPEVTVESCFRYSWNQFGMETYFPMVKDMDWIEV